MSATENGFVITSWTIASRLDARSRCSAKPVINRIVICGKSRAADSASAIPSMTGIWMSVSRRSKPPSSRTRISNASAPSCAAIASCPSKVIARATSLRMESSSSAIRTRAMGLVSGSRIAESRERGPASYTAAGHISPVEEADVDAAPFGRRRGEARLERCVITGLQHGLVQHGIPGIDFGALGVAHREAQPRQLDRFMRFADDGTFDHQDLLALHGFRRHLDVPERKAAQVHVETDRLVERSGLR